MISQRTKRLEHPDQRQPYDRLPNVNTVHGTSTSTPGTPELLHLPQYHWSIVPLYCAVRYIMNLERTAGYLSRCSLSIIQKLHGSCCAWVARGSTERREVRRETSRSPAYVQVQ